MGRKSATYIDGMIQINLLHRSHTAWSLSSCLYFGICTRSQTSFMRMVYTLPDLAMLRPHTMQIQLYAYGHLTRPSYMRTVPIPDPALCLRSSDPAICERSSDLAICVRFTYQTQLYAYGLHIDPAICVQFTYQTQLYAYGHLTRPSYMRTVLPDPAIYAHLQLGQNIVTPRPLS